MNQDLSILHLVLNASFVVQCVMLLLMGVSITSWAAIFRKLFCPQKSQVTQRSFRA
jgi:biopolymer transport protein TolQ